MIKHIAITLFCISSLLFSHCQVPCGIYDDAMRIHQIKEHTQTIIKASVQINSLSNENSGIKFKNEGDSDRKKYIEMTTTLQQMLVSAMKCKQTVSNKSTERLSNLTERFSSIYFDEHGLEHLEELNHK